MSYTPPPGYRVALNFAGSYTPPPGYRVAIEFGDAPLASGIDYVIWTSSPQITYANGDGPFAVWIE